MEYVTDHIPCNLHPKHHQEQAEASGRQGSLPVQAEANLGYSFESEGVAEPNPRFQGEVFLHSLIFIEELSQCGLAWAGHAEYEDHI